MKKLLKIALVLVIVVLVAYVAYRYYLPSTISSSLKSDQVSALLPDDVQEQLKSFKSKVASDVGDLPFFMAEANIDYQDLATMLERVDPGEVSKALLEMSSVRITSTGQAFDIINRNVDIEGYELERFREMFVRDTSVEEIRKAMDKVRDHEFLVTMGMPVVKAVARDVLESSRPEIERQLDLLETSP